MSNGPRMRPSPATEAGRRLLAVDDDTPIFKAPALDEIRRKEIEVRRLERELGFPLGENYQPGKSQMNYSTAVFLINDNARAVLGVFDPENARKYMFKTFNHEIKVDDYVLVETHTLHKMGVARIVEVDVEVDFEDPTTITWIIGQIDRSEIEALLGQEKEAINAVKKAEAEDKRDKLKSSLSKSLAKRLAGLALAGPASKAEDAE